MKHKPESDAHEFPRTWAQTPDGKKVPAYVLHCRSCGKTRAVKANTREAVFPAEFLNKKFQAAGWIVGKSRKDDVCPQCASAPKEQKKAAAETKKVEPDEKHIERCFRAVRNLCAAIRNDRNRIKEQFAAAMNGYDAEVVDYMLDSVRRAFEGIDVCVQDIERYTNPALVDKLEQECRDVLARKREQEELLRRAEEDRRKAEEAVARPELEPSRQQKAELNRLRQAEKYAAIIFGKRA
jgi:hypothetical protein